MIYNKLPFTLKAVVSSWRIEETTHPFPRFWFQLNSAESIHVPRYCHRHPQKRGWVRLGCCGKLLTRIAPLSGCSTICLWQPALWYCNSAIFAVTWDWLPTIRFNSYLILTSWGPANWRVLHKCYGGQIKYRQLLSSVKSTWHGLDNIEQALRCPKMSFLKLLCLFNRYLLRTCYVLLWIVNKMDIAASVHDELPF